MNYLLLLFSLIDFTLLGWAISQRQLYHPRLLFLCCMLFGMFYDNLIQGIGNWLIDASWYEAANVPRFILHAGVLPFLTLFALSIMRAAGSSAGNNVVFSAFCVVFTTVALIFGLYHEAYLLELTPNVALGVQKLGSASNLPPIATILTNILILPMAAMVWRASGWRWFFLGSLFIFLLNGATGAQPWGFLTGNLAEVIFILALLSTHRHFHVVSEKQY